MRADSFFLGFVVGASTVCAAIGLYQLLVSKGYTIATELVEAGWTARELRSHRKAAIVLPMIQRMREDAGAQKFGSGR